MKIFNKLFLLSFVVVSVFSGGYLLQTGPNDWALGWKELSKNESRIVNSSKKNVDEKIRLANELLGLAYEYKLKNTDECKALDRIVKDEYSFNGKLNDFIKEKSNVNGKCDYFTQEKYNFICIDRWLETFSFRYKSLEEKLLEKR